MTVKPALKNPCINLSIVLRDHLSFCTYLWSLNTVWGYIVNNELLNNSPSDGTLLDRSKTEGCGIKIIYEDMKRGWKLDVCVSLSESFWAMVIFCYLMPGSASYTDELFVLMLYSSCCMYCETRSCGMTQF